MVSKMAVQGGWNGCDCGYSSRTIKCLQSRHLDVKYVISGVWTVMVGAKLAFTPIKDSFVAFSSIMAKSICLLILSLSAIVVANVFLVRSNVCLAVPCVGLIDLLSMFLVVISCLGFTIWFAVAFSTRSGTVSSVMLLGMFHQSGPVCLFRHEVLHLVVLFLW